MTLPAPFNYTEHQSKGLLRSVAVAIVQNVPLDCSFLLPLSLTDMPSPDSIPDTDKEAGSTSAIQHIDLANTTKPETTEISAALEARVTHKLDRRLMPWLFGLWLLAFIDRSNIGNARIDGMTEDLHLDANKFNIALAVFYVPYILWDVPSNLVIKHLKAGHYLPGTHCKSKWSSCEQMLILPCKGC